MQPCTADRKRFGVSLCLPRLFMQPAPVRVLSQGRGPRTSGKMELVALLNFALENMCVDPEGRASRRLEAGIDQGDRHALDDAGR